MAWLEKLHHPEKFIKTFLKWGLLGLIMGIVIGSYYERRKSDGLA